MCVYSTFLGALKCVAIHTGMAALIIAGFLAFVAFVTRSK